MIYINDNWESVNDISDVIRIISENINIDCAKKVQYIFDNNSELLDRINELESELYDMECETFDYDDIYDNLNDLEKSLDELDKYILKNDDDSDFIKGMKKAYQMIVERY